jgi:rfaE bifunctional protein kinase chain/domain/rfaE bifunctional protein nucleotidyltransferase chain/domain
MQLHVMRKVLRDDQLAPLGEHYRSAGRPVVLCHGCFDIVHPGHLRYLQFAKRQGELLIVSLTGDDAIEKSDGMRPYVPQELRAESLAALECVDHVVIADDPTAEPIIQALRPDVYVKGKEYEHSTHPGFLREKSLVQSLGGRVIFSSGDVVYSSSNIIQTLEAALSSQVDESQRLGVCCKRWGIDATSLRQVVSGAFIGKKVAVVGDAVLDRYVFCDAMDVAGEAPILSLKPLEESAYLGGAAVIAAHLRAMGATPHLITTVGRDRDSQELLDGLDRRHIAHTTFATRSALPTKLRYLVEAQKLVKIDRAEAQPLDTASQHQMIAALRELSTDLDAIIFTDFGYGTVTTPLLEEALPMLRPRVNTIAGDVSGLRRTMLSMRNVDLLTPTEREVRSVLGDFEASLPSVAGRVMQQLRVGNLAVTMGRKGCVLFRPRESDPAHWFESRLRSEHIPALAPYAVDPVGAGDAFLSAATLMLTTGATLQQAGYLGSAAGALAVQRLGNQPISREDLIHFLGSRPELNHHPIADVG